MEYTINSEYIKDIVFNKCPWDNKYPYNEIGILFWLDTNSINIKIMPINDKCYIWIGYDKSNDDIFTADYNEYETFDDALNCALVECICYLSLKCKK